MCHLSKFTCPLYHSSVLFSTMNISRFKKTIRAYYKKHRRDLPWRRKRDPYRIFVSEIMLQQTQVDRVMPKYTSFIKRFPTFTALANAPLSAVLKEWQGLGYNRRALHLKRAAEIVMEKYKGRLPTLHNELVELPGIGPYTASALRTFIWNKPEIFIETNIRSVFIHHFFPHRKKISDRAIHRYISETLDTKNTREWYYALMDYGSYLKKTIGNVSRKSSGYKKQTAFKGSMRELRGAMLRILGERSTTSKMLRTHTQRGASEIEKALRALTREGLIEKQRNIFRIVP